MISRAPGAATRRSSRQRAAVVGEVLDDVRGEHQVEAAVLERQLLDRAPARTPSSPRRWQNSTACGERSTPSAGAELSRTPSGCGRCRSRRRGCAGSRRRRREPEQAQMTRRRERNHQWRSSMS